MTDLFQPLVPLSPEIDQNKKYLEDLVGEGKKFKDAEELAKGKAHSDSYIKILEARLDQGREEYIALQKELQGRAELTKLIDQLKQPQSPVLPQPKENTPVNEPPVFDQSKLNSLFDERLQSYEKQKKEQANAEIVQSKIREKYGDNISALEKDAKSLGLSKDEVNSLARNNPQVIIKALGLDTKPAQEYQNPVQSQFRDTFRPTGGTKRNFAYYEDLRRKDPNAWYDPKIAVQMQEDAIAAHNRGEVFYPDEN